MKKGKRTWALSFDVFQQTAAEVGKDYPGVGEILGKLFVATRVGEEAGEVLGVVKRLARRHSRQEREHLADEIGDTLHALAQLCDEYGLSLEDVAMRALRNQERKAVRTS